MAMKHNRKRQAQYRYPIAGILCMMSWMVIGTGCSMMEMITSRKSPDQAIKEIDWNFQKDAIQIDITASTDLNTYNGEAHTLLLGVYQIRQEEDFYKLVENPAAVEKVLESGKDIDKFVAFSRYVVMPGQHARLLLDRAQHARYIGFTAGYYRMKETATTRIYALPFTLVKEGMIVSDYKGLPAKMKMSIHFSSSGIASAAVLPMDQSLADSPKTSEKMMETDTQKKKPNEGKTQSESGNIENTPILPDTLIKIEE